ncbi:hypothetical protein D3C76_1262400 [compost metagenome]
MQGHDRQHADLIEDQLHHPLIATAGRVVGGNVHGTDDQLAQQRRDVDHLAVLWQVGAGFLVDEQGAHAHCSGHLQVVFDCARHPHPTPGRHHPAALQRIDRDHPAQGMDQLRAVVAVRGNAFAVAVVFGQGEDGLFLAGGRRHEQGPC